MYQEAKFSYSLLEELIENDYRVCHNIHGITLCDNLLNEPPLSQYIIATGLRDKKTYDKYKNIKCFSATPPIQIFNDIIEARKTIPMDCHYDILIISAFELPFIQKSTYSILEKSFKENFDLKILLRHHPRAPFDSKAILNKYIPYDTISKNKSLVKDINRSKTVVCCSMDALVISLLMKKPTIFLPMVDGDYKYYTRPFIGVLPNLWCPDSAEELTSYIHEALSLEFFDAPSNYEEIIEYLFGSLDMNKFHCAINNIIEYKERV